MDEERFRARRARSARPRPVTAIDPVEEAVLRSLMDPTSPQLPDLADLLQRPRWMERGACRSEEVALFFPGKGATEADRRRAASVCAGCEVRDDCLAFALADEQLRGFWAGTTREDRRVLRLALGADVA